MNHPNKAPDSEAEEVKTAMLFILSYMAVGMIDALGNCFREFGGLDPEHSRLFFMTGTAEDHHDTILLAAFVIQYPGLLAGRWYFLARAKYPQNLYYQNIA